MYVLESKLESQSTQLKNKYNFYFQSKKKQNVWNWNKSQNHNWAKLTLREGQASMHPILPVPPPIVL